jgi:hypothetical protein
MEAKEEYVPYMLNAFERCDADYAIAKLVVGGLGLDEVSVDFWAEGGAKRDDEGREAPYWFVVQQQVHGAEH